MINGYGIALIVWLLVIMVAKVIASQKQAEHPIGRAIGHTLQFIIMVWLIFQI